MKSSRRAREQRLKKSLRAFAALGIIAAIATSAIPLNYSHLKTDTLTGEELSNSDDKHKGNAEEKFEEPEHENLDLEEYFESDKYYDFEEGDEEYKEDDPDEKAKIERDDKSDDKGDEEDRFTGEYSHDFDEIILKNWKRMEKELERSLDQTEELIERIEESGKTVDAGLSARKKRIENLLKIVEERMQQSEDAIENEDKERLSALNSLARAMEIRVAFVVMYDEIWRIKNMMSVLEDEVDTDFSKIDEALEKLEDLRDEVRDIYDGIVDLVDANSEDSKNELFEIEQELFDLNDRVHESFKEFWDMNPGHELGAAEEKLHKENFKDRMAQDLDHMTDMLAQVREFVASLQDIDIADAEVDEAADKLLDLAIKASNLLSDMKAEVEEGNYDLEELWEKMDRIGMAAEDPMRLIANYLEDNESAVSSLSDEARAAYESGVLTNEHHEEDNNFHEDFEYLYGEFDEDNFGDLDEKELRGIMAHLSEDEMEELMEHMQKFDVAKTIKRMLKDFDVYGDKAGELIENYLSVLEAMDVEEAEDLPLSLRGLYFRTIGTMISSESVNDLVSAWKEAVAAAEAGETDFENYENDIDAILNENDENLVRGQSAIEFEDVQHESEDWYRDFVFEGRGEYWDGYSGDREGEFGPSDSVTLAEILKMAMESARIDVYGEDREVSGQWFESYVASAKRLGYGFVENVEDWNSPADRQTVARIIAEVHGLDPVEYRDVYPDVDDFNENAEYLQAVYDAGFMTGKGDGTFDPRADINRAEVAKVIIEAAEFGEEAEFWKELEQY